MHYCIVTVHYCVNHLATNMMVGKVIVQCCPTCNIHSAVIQLSRWTQRNVVEVDTTHGTVVEVDTTHGTVVEVDSMGLKGAIERLLRRRNADDPDKGVERKKHGGNHHHHPRGGQDDIGSDGNSSEKRSKREGGRRCRDKDEQCGGQLDKEQERN